jgi:hypothetical protein
MPKELEGQREITIDKRHIRSLAALVAVAGLLLILLATTERLSPTFMPDSEGYVNFDWSAPLSQTRTVGYPLFLVVVGLFGKDQVAVPLFHWLALSLASIVFYWGLCRIGFRPWTAAWCAIATLLGRSVWDLGHQVIADSLAISLTVAATGFFLGAIATSVRSWAMLGCIGFTFAAYQVRPAFLFLLPLWPLAALLPQMWTAAFPGWKSRIRMSAIFAAGSALPFVAFCIFRGASVGHWGLVSFGGANIVGVAGQLLDEALVAQLTEDVRPLAMRIVQLRNELPEYEPPTSFTAMESMFNPMVWKIAVPVAEGLYRDDRVTLNQSLTNLSHQVLWLRSAAYARWLLWNLNHARQQIIRLTAFDKGTMLAGLLFLFTHLLSLRSCPSELRSSNPEARWIQHRERHILLWLAILFAAGKTALVILVEPANDRYMSPAMVLLPAAFTVFCAQYATAVLFPREA